jgi:hypothetical protein
MREGIFFTKLPHHNSIGSEGIGSKNNVEL